MEQAIAEPAAETLIRGGLARVPKRWTEKGVWRGSCAAYPRYRGSALRTAGPETARSCRVVVFAADALATMTGS